MKSYLKYQNILIMPLLLLIEKYSYRSKSNITEDTDTIVLTDDLILGNLIKDMLNKILSKN